MIDRMDDRVWMIVNGGNIGKIKWRKEYYSFITRKWKRIKKKEGTKKLSIRGRIFKNIVLRISREMCSARDNDWKRNVKEWRDKEIFVTGLEHFFLGISRTWNIKRASKKG